MAAPFAPRIANTPAASESTADGARRRFWDTPERFLLDAGKEGELLIARVRVGLTLVLLLVPIANLRWAASDEQQQHLVGFVITFDVYFVALAGTCLRYDKRVALVAGLVTMLQFVATIVWVDSSFELNSVAGIAMYGRFQWSDQVSRLTMLAAATVLNVYIVDGIQKQKKLSNADPLTGVFNRRFFDDYLRNEFARAARHQAQLSVAMIDVDHSQTVQRPLRSCCRRSGAVPGRAFTRVGSSSE